MLNANCNAECQKNTVYCIEIKRYQSGMTIAFILITSIKKECIVKKYLVTGGCGFIGSHLVDSLINDGHQVRILDDLSTGKRENVPDDCEIVLGDVTDSELVKACMHDIDGCFHLAAIVSVQQSNDDWVRTHQVNLTGTINIFDACKKHKVPVVYASSSAVYGDNAETPLKETSGVRPLTAYGADKLGSELHAKVASLVHGVPTTGMRFFNIYGPRQNPDSIYSGVISIFVDRVLKQKALSLYGDGEQTRDFVYVDDAVRFMRSAMKNNCCIPTTFNVCTGESITIKQLAKTVMSIAGISVPLNQLKPRVGDIRISVGDASDAKQRLKVSAEKSFSQGLRLLVEFTKENSIFGNKQNVAYKKSM